MLICGLIFGGGQVMCCKSLWKRIVSFFLTLSLGLFASNLFVPKDSLNQEIFKKKVSFEQNEQKNCVNIEARILELTKQLLEYKMQLVSSLTWLRENKNTSLKEKQTHLNNLDSLNNVIEKIENQIEIDRKILSVSKLKQTNNLLLIDRYYCYDF